MASFNDYDKVSWIVGYYDRLILKFHTSLGTANKNDKTKRPSYSEVAFGSQKYSNHKSQRNISINANSYLTLEMQGSGFNDSDKRIYINQIGLSHLKRTLRSMERWFFDPSFKLYTKKKGVLNINIEYATLEEFAHIGQAVIHFKPAVITLDDVDYEGVVLYLNNTYNECKMTLDEFSAFADEICNFNMFLAEQGSLNFIQRPEFGTNTYSMNDFNVSEMEAPESSGNAIQGRIISRPSNKDENKSAFDKY